MKKEDVQPGVHVYVIGTDKSEHVIESVNSDGSALLVGNLGTHYQADQLEMAQSVVTIEPPKAQEYPQSVEHQRIASRPRVPIKNTETVKLPQDKNAQSE